MNLSTVKWAQWDKTQSRDLLVCSYVCALHCAQLLHTILHRTDLIIFPLTLQTITTSPMMSIWGKGVKNYDTMLVVKWLPGTIDFTGFNQPVTQSIMLQEKHGFTIAKNTVILAVCRDFQSMSRFCVTAVIITELNWTVLKQKMHAFSTSVPYHCSLLVCTK